MNLKIPPPVTGLIVALLMWLMSRLSCELDFEFPYRSVTAIGLCLIALCIDILALLEFRKSKTTINPMKPGDTSNLVDSGIYRYSRNPMYLGLLIILFAWCLLLGNFAGFLLLPVFIWYLTVFQIIPEETVLQEIFSEKYIQYKQKVRRWI